VTTKDSGLEDKKFILVEGPRWGDAKFYGKWLLAADEANELLRQARCQDPEFHKAIETLELMRLLDFGMMATVFVSQFTDKGFYTFHVELGSEDIIDFVLMANMGFFALTGDRYQMILPPKLDVDTVKQAHLNLALTDDGDWVHPEWFVTDLPYSQVKRYQHLLSKKAEDERLSHREALLSLQREPRVSFFNKSPAGRSNAR